MENERVERDAEPEPDRSEGPQKSTHAEETKGRPKDVQPHLPPTAMGDWATL